MQPNSPYTPGPPAQPTPSQPPEQTPGYDFIMSPAKPPRRSLLPGDTSMAVRIAVVLGGLLVLFILFIFIKGFFSHSNTPALITVAQDQQEIVHLTTNAGQQPLGSTTRDFALTAQLSTASAQSDLLTYMANNGKKVKPKTLNLKVSTALDDQLTASVTNNTYDQLFRQTMQNKLAEYKQALKIAYGQTKGPKGRALLSNDYNSALLLEQQLNLPSG